MKRSWIGFFLLLILLGLGLLSTWAIVEVHEPISDALEEAADCALEGAWAKAAWLTAQAQGIWEKWAILRAALTDHVPIEDIDALFEMLEVYGVSREGISFAAVCRELAQRVEDLGEAHGLMLENLL